MDAVFDAQYRIMRSELAARDVEIEIAFTPSGEVDHLYQVGRLLTVDRDGNLDRIADHLGGRVGRVDADADRIPGRLAEIEVTGMSVPEALARVRRSEATRVDGGDLTPAAPVQPVHLLHITRICPAGEPEPPPYATGTPWPPVRPSGGAGMLIGISDTGLLDDAGTHPWLAGVTGDPDLLPPPGLDGVQWIGQYDGHGTFCAGVARTTAPDADVVVNDHMTASGGELETVFCRKLAALLAGPAVPQILSLSAGTYTEGDVLPAAFADLFDTVLAQHPDVLLLAAAGNDATGRPFWPAASGRAVGVGALGPDQQHRAWFSNYGPNADVWVLGEGMVNAYATGRYRYHEPPKLPSVQDFTGLARWDGTSYATPLYAGMVASYAAEHGVTAREASASLVGGATVVDGLGPALRWDV